MASLKVECWGAGGSGARWDPQGNGGGTGGGGGAYAIKQVNITQKNSYTVTVGTGGTVVGSNSGGVTGGDSWFATTGTVIAKGGSGGNYQSSPQPVSGALGGQSASCIGDTVYSGGNGGALSGNSRNNTGGGGGAGSTGAGGNGTANSTAGGTGGTGNNGGGGGTGDTGGSPAGGGGNYGGGGGAGLNRNASAGGANGIVVLTLPIGSISNITYTNAVHSQSGGNDIWTYTTTGTLTVGASSGDLINIL